jgi:hypothetical protein
VYGCAPALGIDCFYGSNKSALCARKLCAFSGLCGKRLAIEESQNETSAKKQGQIPLTLRSHGLSVLAIVPPVWFLLSLILSMVAIRNVYHGAEQYRAVRKPNLMSPPAFAQIAV